MSPTQLLMELQRCDVTLTVVGDRLRVDAPTGAVTPELRDALVMHKAELLGLLLEHSCSDSPTRSDRADRFLDMTLTQFAREGVSIEVGVDWREGSFWFVPTVADVECLARQGVSRGRIWTAAELMDLMSIPKVTADQLKTIAAVKLEFGGQLIQARPRGKRCGERDRGEAGKERQEA